MKFVQITFRSLSECSETPAKCADSEDLVFVNNVKSSYMTSLIDAKNPAKCADSEDFEITFLELSMPKTAARRMWKPSRTHAPLRGVQGGHIPVRTSIVPPQHFCGFPGENHLGKRNPHFPLHFPLEKHPSAHPIVVARSATHPKITFPPRRRSSSAPLINIQTKYIPIPSVRPP
jgi:hypothetical protein